MPRKRKQEYIIAGRPPKDPMEKVGRPVRALVTPPVMEALEVDMQNTGTNLSEILRLALYQRLVQQGIMTPELMQDPTWESLQQKGLV